jgi:hypothetical protein
MRASEHLPAVVLAAVTVARESTLDALERLTAVQSTGPDAVDAIVAMQAAANQLGAAEDSLARLNRARDTQPAPIVDSPAAPFPQPPTRWTGEALAVTGLAEATVPYASGPADGAELWLRALRREGAVGRAMEDLGMPERELTVRAEPVAASHEALDAVREQADALARQRGADAVTTTDVLFAVLARYGTHADRALYESHLSREDLLEKLARLTAPGVPAGVPSARG